MIKVGIVGGAGYAAGELIRILIGHPEVEISFVFSTSSSGQPVTDVHPDLIGDFDLNFSDSLDSTIDVLFLCTGHGVSRDFLDRHPQPDTVKIIDLSQDFRIAGDHPFIYGLPELNRGKIKEASHVANPGCFATAIQLALLPLAKSHLLTEDIHINAVTGSTGAGQSLSETSHFSWRNNNVSAYKVFEHQHLAEIGQSLRTLQDGFNEELYFVPIRGNFTRGIFATLYTNNSLAEDLLQDIYREFYDVHPFTWITDGEVSVKQAVNTNKAIIGIAENKGKAFITVAIDNLLKGASGQAVQNMNLMFDIPEGTGLYLKPSAF